MVTFALPKTIAGTFERDAEAPHIAASGNNVYIIWHERPNPPPPPPDTPTDHEVWLSRSTNKGANFGQRQNISNTPGNSDGEVLAVRGDNVYVAWIDLGPAGVATVKLRRSTDRGQNFGSTKPLSVALNPLNLDIVASGSDVYVSYLATGPNASDVFVAHSDNNGQSFKPEVNVSNNTAGRNALDPQVATSNNRVVVTWRNDPDPNAVPSPERLRSTSRRGSSPVSRRLPGSTGRRTGGERARAEMKDPGLDRGVPLAGAVPLSHRELPGSRSTPRRTKASGYFQGRANRANPDSSPCDAPGSS